MSTPAKPETAFRRTARALEVGMALGVLGFIVNAFIGGEIARMMIQSESDSLAGQILMLVLPALILAPLMAFGVGLLIEGPVWKIAVAQNVTLQTCIVLVSAVSIGVSEFFTPSVVAIELGLCAAGSALSGLAMARAQQQKAEPTRQQTGHLADIDFEKVKQQAGLAAAQPAPALPQPAAEAPAAQAAPAPVAPPAAAAPAAAAVDQPAPTPAPAAAAAPPSDAEPKA